MKTKTKFKKEAITYFLVACISGIFEIFVYFLIHKNYSIDISNLVAYSFGVSLMFILLKLFVYQNNIFEKKSIKQFVLTVIMHFCVFEAQCFLLTMFEDLFSTNTYLFFQNNASICAKLMANVSLYPFVWLGNRNILKWNGVVFYITPFFIKKQKKSIFFDIFHINMNIFIVKIFWKTI